jgi:hypothetical protein
MPAVLRITHDLGEEPVACGRASGAQDGGRTLQQSDERCANNSSVGDEGATLEDRPWKRTLVSCAQYTFSKAGILGDSGRVGQSRSQHQSVSCSHTRVPSDM